MDRWRNRERIRRNTIVDRVWIRRHCWKMKLKRDRRLFWQGKSVGSVLRVKSWFIWVRARLFLWLKICRCICGSCCRRMGRLCCIRMRMLSLSRKIVLWRLSWLRRRGRSGRCKRNMRFLSRKARSRSWSGQINSWGMSRRREGEWIGLSRKKAGLCRQKEDLRCESAIYLISAQRRARENPVWPSWFPIGKSLRIRIKWAQDFSPWRPTQKKSQRRKSTLPTRLNPTGILSHRPPASEATVL